MEPSVSFDVILLDAPCSATGTWRRHPEVVRLATPEKIATLVELQRHLLQRAWSWLKQGGRMVYCVCSLEPEEGEQQIARFLATQPDAKLAPSPSPLNICAMACCEPYQHAGEKGGMDGFLLPYS